MMTHLAEENGFLRERINKLDKKAFKYACIYIYNMTMKLPIPPEPKEQKQKWKEELRSGGGRMNPARVTIKQGTWLTSPLWSKYDWKEQLKKSGISWQKFMELYRNVYHNFIGWVEGSITWEDGIKSFIKEIEEEIKRHSPL